MELKKQDCISLDDAIQELGIARNTLNTYLIALNVTKHKFPLDRRVYITNADFTRVRTMIEENRSSKKRGK